MRIIQTTMLILALAGGVATAETRINRTETLPRGGTVDVEMIAGELTIEGWSRDEVEVTGTLYHRCESFEMDRDDRGIDIEVDWDCESDVRMRENSVLRIMVPRDAGLRVETVSVALRLSGTDGDVDVETISGHLDVRTGARNIELASVSGGIDLVAESPVSEADFETVSGGIRAELDLDSGAQLRAESVSGSITLRLPARVSAEFEIETFSGNIRSDFGERPRRTSEYLPSQELVFRLGGGSARVDVETLSGRISLEKR